MSDPFLTNCLSNGKTQCKNTENETEVQSQISKRDFETCIFEPFGPF